MCARAARIWLQAIGSHFIRSFHARMELVEGGDIISSGKFLSIYVCVCVLINSLQCVISSPNKLSPFAMFRGTNYRFCLCLANCYSVRVSSGLVTTDNLSNLLPILCCRIILITRKIYHRGRANLIVY